MSGEELLSGFNCIIEDKENNKGNVGKKFHHKVSLKEKSCITDILEITLIINDGCINYINGSKFYSILMCGEFGGTEYINHRCSDPAGQITYSYNPTEDYENINYALDKTTLFKEAPIGKLGMRIDDLINNIKSQEFEYEDFKNSLCQILTYSQKYESKYENGLEYEITQEDLQNLDTELQ